MSSTPMDSPRAGLPAPAPSFRLDPEGQSTQLGRKIALFALAAILSVGSGLAIVRVDPPLVVGAVCCCMVVLAVLRWPFAGLMIYLLVFILRPGALYESLAPLRLERVVGLLTLMSLVLHQMVTHGRIFFDFSMSTRKLLFLVAAAAASIPLAVWRAGAIEGVVDFLKILVFYLLIVQLIDSKKRLRAFVLFYCILIGYIAVASTGDFLRGSILVAQGIERAQGASSVVAGPNELGATMATTVPLFLLLGRNANLRRWRGLWFAMLGLLVVTLVITGSRSGLLGFMAGLGYLWWGSRHKLLLGFVGVVLMAGAFVALPEQYKGRYSTMTEKQLDGSSSERIKVWNKGVRMFADRPLTGVGINCFGTANAYGYSTGRASWLESHSLYVQVPAEMGLLGILGFFGMLIHFMRSNRKTAAALRRHSEDWSVEADALTGIFGGFVCLLVTGIFGHSMMRITWYIYGAIGLATLRVFLQQATDLAPEQRRELVG